MLFDFDGTIIDTMGEYARIVCRMLEEELGYDCEETKRKYLSLAGRPFREQLRLMGVPQGLVEKVARRFEEEKRRLLAHIVPEPLVFERLNLLRRRGLRVALSTNNECRLVEQLEWVGRLFDIVLCHDPERGTRKGLSHLLELERLGFRRCEIIFVGDSPYDIEVYEPLGIRSVRTLGLWRPEDRAIEKVLSVAGLG